MTATMTRRYQLSRRRGAHMPPNCVSVAYSSRFANPHRPAVRSVEANTAAVEAYRKYLRGRPDLVELARRLLAGKDLACVCPLDLPCHANVLLSVARGGDP